jgi:hypothetical protein
MTRQYLVILRCGRNSLHWNWLLGAERNWDLVLCPFQDIDPEPEALFDDFKVEGQKWLGIYKLLTEWPDWRRYDYIWLPDDDLLTDAGTINRLFTLSTAFNATISAPALSKTSFYSHEITLQNDSFFARATTFIEVMMPCLRRDVLALCLPSIGKSKSGYGWGLDFLWPHLLNYEGLIIFDRITVEHTRPIGATRNTALVDQGNQEMADNAAEMGGRIVIKTLGAYNENGNLTAADPRGFTLDLLNGYRYLIERHDHLLEMFVQRQIQKLPERHTSGLNGRKLTNVALKKPATLSSVSQWSRSQIHAEEAAGGNDGNIQGGNGFHTAFEENPWWAVDLLKQVHIHKIILYNRLDLKERCVKVLLSCSDDNQDWRVMAAKLDDAVFGGADGNPLVVVFDTPMTARYVKVTMLGEGFLHLDEIEVYADAGA